MNDSFGDFEIKDNVEFFKEFRKNEKVNDIAMFCFFSLKGVREYYKKENKILSFLLEDSIIQKFRESFDKTKKYQHALIDYFNLPLHEKHKLVSKQFGEKGKSFYLNFYPLYNMFVHYAAIHQKKKYQLSIEICDKLQL